MVKLRNIQARPAVALNLDGDGQGGDIIVVTGQARISATDPPANKLPACLEKYREAIARIGMTPESFEGVPRRQPRCARQVARALSRRRFPASKDDESRRYPPLQIALRASMVTISE